MKKKNMLMLRKKLERTNKIDTNITTTNKNMSTIVNTK